jgi:hypothetical protein
MDNVTNPLAHDALNRIQRAHERGTGCYLTAEMVEALSLTYLGEIWSEPDPRKVSKAFELQPVHGQ